MNLSQIEHTLLRKNYSPNTIKAYIYYLTDYKNFCERQNISITDNVEVYIRQLISKNCSESTQNQAINAIKFYFEQVMGLEKVYYSIDRPKKAKKLPTILSIEEVSSILQVIENEKHKTIITTIYACGLRISEVLHLEIAHICGKRKTFHLKGAKGKKDRMVPVPEELLILLRRYYKKYTPYQYLFEGVGSRKEHPIPYSAGSIRKILHRASLKAKIKKRVTPHTLRHSYATHLYENGISLRSIQVLLGHDSSKTTEIYTHVTNRHIINTPSPLQFLKKGVI